MEGKTINRSRLFYLVTFPVIISIFVSCLKKEEYPVVPQIAYEGFTLEFDSGLYAQRGYLTISFKDGDGDLGLEPDQKYPPFNEGSKYYYNYYIDYYEKRNGIFYKVDLGAGYNSRFPNLTQDDPNKAIKGIIVDTLDFFPPPAHDTIMLKFFIYDRALHQSNIDSTPPVILRRR
jgi:hypothetical protein